MSVPKIVVFEILMMRSVGREEFWNWPLLQPSLIDCMAVFTLAAGRNAGDQHSVAAVNRQAS